MGEQLDFTSTSWGVGAMVWGRVGSGRSGWPGWGPVSGRVKSGCCQGQCMGNADAFPMDSEVKKSVNSHTHHTNTPTHTHRGVSNSTGMAAPTTKNRHVAWCRVASVVLYGGVDSRRAFDDETDRKLISE